MSNAAPSHPNRRLRATALLAAVALLVLGNGLQSTLVGVRGGIEGMSEAMIGLIMSGYFVGYVLGSIYAPSLIQTVGHIRAFAALASIASAAALGYALAVEPATWLVLRAISGACYAGMIIVVESWLNASTDRQRRGRVLALYGIVFYAAWAAGQPLLNAAPVDGFALFAVVSIALSLALVPITLTQAGVPGVVEARRTSLSRLYAISPQGLVGAFALGLALGAFWGMAPTFAHVSAFSTEATSLFLSLPFVGALLVQWPLGWLSDRMDRRRVILGATAAGSLCAAGLALTSGAMENAALVLVLLLGASSLPVYSLCVAHVNDHIDPGEVVAASSGLILVHGLGAALGPIVASLSMTLFGPGGLFLLMAVILGLFAGYSMQRMVVSAPPAAHEKDSYVSVPQTSHAVLPLHRHSPTETEGRRAPQ